MVLETMIVMVLGGSNRYGVVGFQGGGGGGCGAMGALIVVLWEHCSSADPENIVHLEK